MEHVTIAELSLLHFIAFLSFVFLTSSRPIVSRPVWAAAASWSSLLWLFCDVVFLGGSTPIRKQQKWKFQRVDESRYFKTTSSHPETWFSTGMPSYSNPKELSLYPSPVVMVTQANLWGNLLLNWWTFLKNQHDWSTKKGSGKTFPDQRSLNVSYTHLFLLWVSSNCSRFILITENRSLDFLMRDTLCFGVTSCQSYD